MAPFKAMLGPLLLEAAHGGPERESRRCGRGMFAWLPTGQRHRLSFFTTENLITQNRRNELLSAKSVLEFESKLPLPVILLRKDYPRDTPEWQGPQAEAFVQSYGAFLGFWCG